MSTSKPPRRFGSRMSDPSDRIERSGSDEAGPFDAHGATSAPVRAHSPSDPASASSASSHRPPKRKRAEKSQARREAICRSARGIH